jgi:hypothetical protein
MTFLYTRTNTWNRDTSKTPSDDIIDMWRHISDKTNWRIVQLPNGYLQTEYKSKEDSNVWIDVTRRETLEGAEQAIDASIEHYGAKINEEVGPKIIKTFE